jgi:hypothetical protein
MNIKYPITELISYNDMNKPHRNPNAFPEGVERTVPNWPAVQPNDNSYLVIDNSDIRASTNYPDSWVIQNKKSILCSNSRINSLHNFAMFLLPILLFVQM